MFTIADSGYHIVNIIDLAMPNFIFVTGGVVSSLGKGVCAASIGVLLQNLGFSIKLKKLDPYLNVDPGTMSPMQHGEVFVTEDGAETDLDLGYYERFTTINTTTNNSITSGKIYQKLLTKERNGDYLGNTVQVIPHVTNLIKDFIYKNNGEDFIICEIGGTIGDIESLPFLESIRQIKYELEVNSVMFVHLTLIPFMSAANVLKTKPTQHSVKELRSIGIQPDLLLCRTERDLETANRKKIALFCNVAYENVIPGLDVRNIYTVPIEYYTHKLHHRILSHFALKLRDPDLKKWKDIEQLINQPKAHQINIAIIAKYESDQDSYKSLIEALKVAALKNDTELNIKWVDAQCLTSENLEAQFKNTDALLVPGGFGARGVTGKMFASQYARENNTPFLGICFGMQIALLEFAKNVVQMEKPYSIELDDIKDGQEIISLTPEFKSISNISHIENADVQNADVQARASDKDLNKASDKDLVRASNKGKMRLGSYECIINDKQSLAYDIYQQNSIMERHRHRYVVNQDYINEFTKYGIEFSITSAEGNIPEAFEIKKHRFFIAVQFHPEFRSNIFQSHKLFDAFVAEALVNSKEKRKNSNN